MRFEIRNGSFGYGASQVPHQISLDLEENQVLAVLGPNGVGKTTFLKYMMGLLKWDFGESRIDGAPVNILKRSEIWKRIVYVPQSRGISLSCTALEMVITGRSARLGLSAQSSRGDMEVAKASTEEVGITFLTDRPCGQMSGGESQMVLVAGVLYTQSEVLISDELEPNLDLKNQLVVLGMIRQLFSNRDIETTINTHYPAHVLKVADKALMLDRDKSSFYGGAGEAITEDSMKKTFAVEIKIADYYYEGVSYPNVIPIQAFSPMSSHSS